MQNILFERLPTMDIEIQGNHENKENNCVVTLSHKGVILSQLEIISSESWNQLMMFSLQDPHL